MSELAPLFNQEFHATWLSVTGVSRVRVGACCWSRSVVFLSLAAALCSLRVCHPIPFVDKEQDKEAMQSHRQYNNRVYDHPIQSFCRVWFDSPSHTFPPFLIVI